MTEKEKSIFYCVLIGLMAFLPLLSITVPRFLAFGPAILGVFGFIIYFFCFKEKVLILKPALIIVLGIVLLASLSSLWSIDPGFSLKRTLKVSGVLLPGIVFLSILQRLSYQSIHRYLWFIPFVLAITSVLLFLEQNLGEPLYRFIRELEDTDEVGSAVYNRATVTTILCAFPAYCILGTYDQAKIWRMLFCLSFLPLLLVTQSQSAQLALIVGIAFMAVFPYSRKWVWLTLMAVLAFMTLLFPFIVIWLFDVLDSSIYSLPFLKEGFAGPRMEIWDYVSRYMLQNPFYGYGIEATRLIQDFDTHEVYQEGRGILHPHNFILQLWIEFGVIGILSGLSIMLYILRTIFNSCSLGEQKIYLPTMMAIMSVATTGYGMWQSWWLGLVLLVIGICFLAGQTYRDGLKDG